MNISFDTYCLKIIFLILIFSSVLGCAGTQKQVRQQDLDAWVGMPVEALDTQSFFLTLPMVKTVIDSGIEIRVYPNKKTISSCGGFGFVSNANFQSFQSCSAQLYGCDNIFYIKEKRIIQYKPVGNCYTDEIVLPEAGYQKFIN